jgi:8-oxo-dGTP pyrophosphatase MutT (NUDIX family)
VLHEVAAADPVVTLPRLAAALNQPKDRVAARLTELEELGLVRLARTPAPIVAQITELGEAVLADPAAGYLAVERLDDQQRAALRRRIDVVAARIRPARTHVGPDLRLRREQRSSRADRKPPPDAPPDRSPGGPLGLLSDEEIALAQQAFAAVRAASVDTPQNPAHRVRIRGPPPDLRPGEELFSPAPEAVVAALGELDASPQQVARILRAWAFSWRDADGTVVFALFADRLAELQRLGLLARVLRHERDDVAGRFAGEHEHDQDVAVVWQAIREAQASVPGPALALLDELPAGEGLRRTRLEEWDPDFLREIAAGSVGEALLAVLDAQGMGGPPAPVDAARWRELLAAGHRPLYRGFRGEQAGEEAEQFRSGERPVLGLAADMGGTGSNFSTDPATAGRYARIVSLPNPFRPLRRRPPAEVVLIGYLHPDAVVLGFSEAYQRQQADVAAARRRGEDELARLLADLGVWAALHGIDAVYQQSGRLDRHYLVLNRGAMLVETAESMAELAGRERDWSGDGLVPCRCGDEHFGIHGAASMLLVHRAPDGTVRVLMQRRSAAVQHGGTWALPGGARGLREPALRTAMRETWEETGLDPSAYTVRDVHVDDHVDWSHTTVLAETDSQLTLGALSPEVAEVAWVRLDDLATLPRHPGFAASWPAVSAALLGGVGIGTRATSPGATPDTAGDPAPAPDPGVTHRPRFRSGTVRTVLLLGVPAGLALLAGGTTVVGAVVGAVVAVVGWLAVTDVAARLLARWVWPVRSTETPHGRDTRPDAAELTAELLDHPGFGGQARRAERPRLDRQP